MKLNLNVQISTEDFSCLMLALRDSIDYNSKLFGSDMDERISSHVDACGRLYNMFEIAEFSACVNGDFE